ncbi:MAG: lysylphosphatidylglycerol synthase transmembrane domain-containing protein, partial [Acidimicrobiia bacterium]|nr:lysylphosphatidylglycerol synthase transmembrane domain-containing protein [Acidimicrobiia bacterium]
LWLGQAAYVVGVVYAFGLFIGVGIFAKDRLELLRDLLLAAVLAVVAVVLLSQWLDDRWPELAFFDLDQTRETFPAFFVTTSVAIQAAASPHLTAPMRKIGWTFILAAVGASVLGGVTTVSDALGGLLVGLIAAALVRYALGTSAGLPSTNRIRSGLADLGVEMTDLEYTGEQPAGSIVLTGTSSDGIKLFVGGLGRDSWNTRRWTRLWKSAWYQDQGAQYGSDRRQQVEHEALAMLLADQSGAPVPELVTVGMTARDDAILVSTLLDHTLRDVSADDVDDDLLDAIWGALASLHRANISHGSLDPVHIWFDSSGAPALMGFADSAIHPTREQLHEDIAAMLVMTTLVVGTDRAIAASRRAQGDDALQAMLPVLQTASLNARLRHLAKNQKLKVGDLRKQTAAAIGTDVPEIEQLTRVTWKSVVMLGFIGFAAYTIVGGLAEVGFDTILETLADARWSLVILGLVLAAATNYTDAVAVAAVSPKPVPIGVTTVEQFAIGFVNIAVPSAAGRVATNARYFQKFGISAVTSTTTGAITGFIGFIAQAILVVLTILIGAGSIDFSEMQGGGGVIRLLVMAILVFVGVLVVVALIPKWRHWAWSKVEKPMSQIGDAFDTVKDPKTAITALGSSIGTEVLYGAGFAMCVLAVGGSVSLGEAIFINVTVSLFAGLMPIPGGVGVSEAGMTAGLTAVGVPSDIAVAAVLVYRLISYYLPPLWGYVSLRWLTRHDYL